MILRKKKKKKKKKKNYCVKNIFTKKNITKILHPKGY